MNSLDDKNLPNITWAPVFFEPIQGSEERVAIAVGAVDVNGDVVFGTLDDEPIILDETGPLPTIEVIDNDPFFCSDEE